MEYSIRDSFGDEFGTSASINWWPAPALTENELNESSGSESGYGVSGNETNFYNDSWSQNSSSMEMPIDMQFNDGHLLSIIGYSILFVFSAFGNLTVLSVILKRKFYGVTPISRMDFMLLHLAVADLMVAFLMMPLEIVWSATVSWYGGDFMCRVMAFFRVFGLYLSSFVLVCLAFDRMFIILLLPGSTAVRRYFAVRYPMQIVSSSKRGKIMIVLAWVFAAMCSMPQVFIFHVAQHPVFNWYWQCVDFGSLTTQTQLIYNVFVMCMMYAFPLVFIIGLYCGIILELYHRTQTTSGKRASNSTPQHRNSIAPSQEGLRRSGMGNLGRAKAKTLKMTIMIVVIFIVCWTPYYIMCLWYWIDNSSAKGLDQKIQKALFLFASTNSTANPIVYGVFHLKSTFCRKPSSVLNDRAGRFQSQYGRSSVYRSDQHTQLCSQRSHVVVDRSYLSEGSCSSYTLCTSSNAPTSASGLYFSPITQHSLSPNSNHSSCKNRSGLRIHGNGAGAESHPMTVATTASAYGVSGMATPNMNRKNNVLNNSRTIMAAL